MKLTSISAIYFLIFCFSAFVLLPFGVKPISETDEEMVPGQATSAPVQFDLKRHLLRSAIVAAGGTFLYWLNYVNGWLTADMFDFYH